MAPTINVGWLGWPSHASTGDTEGYLAPMSVIIINPMTGTMPTPTVSSTVSLSIRPSSTAALLRCGGVSSWRIFVSVVVIDMR